MAFAAQGVSSSTANTFTTMAKIYAIANQKGGAGKTSTTNSLATALAVAGERTLIVDLDQQGNSTRSAGFDLERNPDAFDAAFFDAVVPDRGKRMPTAAAILRGVLGIPTLDLLAGDDRLAGIELALASTTFREHFIKNAVAQVVDDYDHIFLDCPPALGLTVQAAVVAADYVITPIAANERNTLGGARALVTTVEELRADERVRATMRAFVVTTARQSESAYHEILEDLTPYAETKGIPIASVHLSRSTVWANAVNAQMPVLLFRGRTAHGALAARREILRLAGELFPEVRFPEGSEVFRAIDALKDRVAEERN